MKNREPKELAKILNINEQTVCRMLRDGQIAGGKVGGRWRISDEVILEYLRTRNLLPSGQEVTVDDLLAASAT